MPLELTTSEPRPGVVVIALTGELDLAFAEQVQEAIAAVPGKADLLIDLSACEFLDSTGLALLINARKEFAEAGRRLILCAPGPQVARLLEVTGLDREEIVRPSLDDALDDSLGQLAD
jgi:anti-sigma B factor antagonist